MPLNPKKVMSRKGLSVTAVPVALSAVMFAPIAAHGAPGIVDDITEAVNDARSSLDVTSGQTLPVQAGPKDSSDKQGPVKSSVNVDGLEDLTFEELQRKNAILESQFVKASMAYEEAKETAKAAIILAKQKKQQAEEAADKAKDAEKLLSQFAAEHYADGISSSNTLRFLGSSEEQFDELTRQMMVGEQVADAQAVEVGELKELLVEAQRMHQEAEAAEEAAEKAEKRADLLLVDIEQKAAAVAAAANAQLTVGSRGALFADAEQKARNNAALKNWKEYLNDRAEAGVFPWKMKDLKDPKNLPRGLRPVRDRTGKRVPGIAQTFHNGKAITVLPLETVNAVSKMFSKVGRPYVPYKAGPKTFDCSGLISTTWRGTDFAVPRKLEKQWNDSGRKVARRDKQVGDNIFLGNPDSGVHSVGIYLGGGYVITADGTANQVGVQRINDKIRRVTRPTLPNASPYRKAMPTESAPRFRQYCGISTAPQKAAPVSGMFWPMRKGTYSMSAHFGKAGPLWSSGYHTGQDFSAAAGIPVYAAKGGTVTVSSTSWAGPNYVIIDHGNGIETTYAHMMRADVKTGDRVRGRQQIGAIGSLGNSTGPHLHFEVHVNDKGVDPMPWLTGDFSPSVVGTPGATSWGGYRNGKIPLRQLCALKTGTGQMLRCDAAHSFEAMAAAYQGKFGTPLCITDSYRSYEAQVSTYAAKPTLAAIPGTSNHGWGLAVDLCGGVESFSSPQHSWLKSKAGLYGWVLPPWAQANGSKPEPWHWEFGRIS